MSTPKRFVVTAALVLGWMVSLAPAQPLPVDPALVNGELENGLRYIVKQHANPSGRAVIWIHFHTGSLNETDRQRGIAHYLEHMAFNGSANFPPGSLVPYFQSLGMTFGRDQNAFTNYEQTTYQLSLPDAKPETLAKGMTFFSDIVCCLSLLPGEIDAERQIILEERRRRLSAGQRVNDYVLDRIAPGTLYANREPIGLEETIKGVTEADFKDYYGKWYTASNATLIVVADAAPADIIKVVKDKFDRVPRRPRPEPQQDGVKAFERSFAIVAGDPESRGESLRIVHVEPPHPPVTTVPQFRDELTLGIGERAFNRRMRDKASAGGLSYQGVSASSGNRANAIHMTEISVSPARGKWRSALEDAALELQRARAYGFHPGELEDARKELLSSAERAIETESSIQAAAIMARINGSLASGAPVMSPQQRLELLETTLTSITPEAVAKKFADRFDCSAVAFIAVLPQGPNAPSEAELLELGTKALAAKPEKEVEVAHATTLMDELPAPGKVVEASEHAASKVWSGWLSNNARVHYRFMDERKNEARVQISLIGGELLETADNRGITAAANLAWSRPATDKLSSSDIGKIMTGRKVSLGGAGGGGGGRGGGRRGGGGGGGGGLDDAISLSISGSPEELETGFQLAYLLLTEPKIEQPAFQRYRSSARQTREESIRSASALGARTVAAATYPDDEPRTKPPTREQLRKIDLESAQAWLEKLIAESPIEVAIVGDIPRERAIELAARYIGSLPSRERITPEAFNSLRHLKRPEGFRAFDKVANTQTDQAWVFSGFYGADQSNRDDVRVLNMAARVMSSRMTREVREEQQLVYSIGATSRASSVYPGFGMFSASAPTDPAKVPALAAKLSSMYEAFAKDGPTEEELSIARKQMANTFEQQKNDPAVWMGRLTKMTFRGENLDDALSAPAAYQAMTTQQVKDTFAKYYSKDNAIVVTVKPRPGEPDEPAEAPDEEPAAGAPAEE